MNENFVLVEKRCFKLILPAQHGASEQFVLTFNDVVKAFEGILRPLRSELGLASCESFKVSGDQVVAPLVFLEAVAVWVRDGDSAALRDLGVEVTGNKAQATLLVGGESPQRLRECLLRLLSEAECHIVTTIPRHEQLATVAPSVPML